MVGHDEAVILAPLAGVVVRPIVGVLGGAPGQVRAVVDPCSHLQAKDQIWHKAFFLLPKCFLIYNSI